MRGEGDGIWRVVSVWLATVPETEVLTEPEGVWLANAVSKATVPPVPTVPLVIRNALSLWLVSFVHPVGAAV